MKKFFGIAAIALALSGCTIVVNEPFVVHTPQPTCYWVDVPVYGYADIYRSNGTTVRIREVAYVEKQRRCH
jgi:GTP-binding protein EngB required for normal cell division